MQINDTGSLGQATSASSRHDKNATRWHKEQLAQATAHLEVSTGLEDVLEEQVVSPTLPGVTQNMLSDEVRADTIVGMQQVARMVENEEVDDHYAECGPANERRPDLAQPLTFSAGKARSARASPWAHTVLSCPPRRRRWLRAQHLRSASRSFKVWRALFDFRRATCKNCRDVCAPNVTSSRNVCNIS